MSAMQEDSHRRTGDKFSTTPKAELGRLPYEEMAVSAVANLPPTPEVIDNAIRGVQGTLTLFTPDSTTINQDTKKLFMETLYTHSIVIGGYGFIRRYREGRRIRAWVRALERVFPQPVEVNPNLPMPEFVEFYEGLRREEFPQPKFH